MAEGLNLLGESLSVRIRVDYEGAHLSHATALFTLDELRECLAAQGLHIVTAGEKAVLATCADLADSTCLAYQRSGPFRFVAQTELFRREKAKP